MSGDALKTYLLLKDKNVNAAKAAASIVIKDVLEVIVVLSYLILGIILLAFDYSISTTIMVAIGFTMVLLALPILLVVYFSLNVGATEKLLRVIERISARIKKKEVAGVKEKVHNQIIEFREGILTIRKKPKTFVKPIVFQSLACFFDILTLFVVFTALGSFIGFDKVVITNSIITNVRGQGVALAGLSQIISGGLYEALGITTGVAVASSLLAGFTGFWFKLLLSFGFFQVTVLTVAALSLNPSFSKNDEVVCDNFGHYLFALVIL